MPGPFTIFGAALVAAVNEGRTEVATWTTRCAGCCCSPPASARSKASPPPSRRRDAPRIADPALPREIAQRSFVLAKNDVPGDGDEARDPAARHAVDAATAASRSSGPRPATPGCSAAARPPCSRSRSSPRWRAPRSPARRRRAHLRGRRRPVDPTPPRRAGSRSGPRPRRDRTARRTPLRTARSNGWARARGSPRHLHAVDLDGTFTPQTTGEHVFAITGAGVCTLTLDGEVIFDGAHTCRGTTRSRRSSAPAERARSRLDGGRAGLGPPGVHPGGLPARTWPPSGFALMHAEPAPDPDAGSSPRPSSAAQRRGWPSSWSPPPSLESEGFDRRDLRLPGRQDELVTPSPRSTRTRSSSSTPAPRSRCLGATTSPRSS